MASNTEPPSTEQQQQQQPTTPQLASGSQPPTESKDLYRTIVNRRLKGFKTAPVFFDSANYQMQAQGVSKRMSQIDFEPVGDVIPTAENVPRRKITNLKETGQKYMTQP